MSRIIQSPTHYDVSHVDPFYLSARDLGSTRTSQLWLSFWCVTGFISQFKGINPFTARH